MTTASRRQLILETAARLFGHYGPAKTTIGDIAREAGIGVGSVYLEFESKDDIVRELAGERHQRVVVGMRNAARRGDHATRIAAALEARVRILFELAQDGAHACDLMSCGGAAKPRPSVGPGRFAEAERELLVTLLRAGIDAGEFEPVEPDQVARTIEHAYSALSPPWIYCQEPEDAASLSRALGHLLVFGLRARSGARPRRLLKRRKAR